jgi:ABC-type transport system involved in cytochrome c biogenesis permease component
VANLIFVGAVEAIALPLFALFFNVPLLEVLGSLVANFWVGQLAYWIGPILGAVVAMQLYERVLLKRE